MKKIYYLSYFDIPEHAEQKRNYVLSATTKSEYECKALAKAGYKVEIVSASGTCSDEFCQGSTTELCDNLILRLFDAKPTKTTLQRIFARRFMKKQLSKYLLDNITENDVLIVYHSMAYADLVQKIKLEKNPLLIIEANEIYADVTGNENTREAEQNFLQSADAYILSTELLNEKINVNNRPYVVNYGTFEDTPKLTEKINDGKIHAVYAGVLEPRKGAQLAVCAAEFLPENYHIHIIGFGSEKDIHDIKTLVDEVSQKTKCTVTYDGKYGGEDYIRFLQSCHIGLATQNKDASFNETSFPSKVLSYLSNGLRVISVRIKAIEVSKVADLMYFYNNDSAKEVADAIMSIDFTDNYDSRKTLRHLNSEFVNGFSILVNRSKK